MPRVSKPLKAQAKKASPVATPVTTLWSGTGLCCEAQGDGVPCRGVDGECEVCGRALPRPAEGT